jgi:hypothetical protein
MIPFRGFTPNVDEHAEGVISDCEMMLPTIRGMKAAPSLTSAGYSALSAQCYGAAYVTKLDKTTRLFAATQNKLYEGSGGAWTEVSRSVAPASATTYTGVSDSVWRFAQYGDVSLATSGNDTVQKSVSSGQFTDLTGAPKANLIETVAGFVMLGGYNAGTDTPDGLFWSGLYDYTTWTPSVSTGCGNVRLLDTPGRITAIKRFGSMLVAYKDDSMYLGSYEPGLLWTFQLVSSKAGAVSQECVVSTGVSHVFVGNDNIWTFDGASRPVPIGEEIREWFFDDLSLSYRHRIQATYDRNNALVYIYYSSASATLDRCLVYNVKANKWGRANRTIEATLEYLSSGYTYAGMESSFSAYSDIPGVSYGSPFWTAGEPNMAIFDTSHTLQLLTGAGANSSITTGAIGDDAMLTLLKRVQPRFTNDPSTGSMANYYRMTDGANFTQDANANMFNGRFDVLRSARWHKVKTTYTGDVEVTGNSYLIVPEGAE